MVAITGVRRVLELGVLSVGISIAPYEGIIVVRANTAFIPKIYTVPHRSQEFILPSFCPHAIHALKSSGIFCM